MIQRSPSSTEPVFFENKVIAVNIVILLGLFNARYALAASIMY